MPPAFGREPKKTRKQLYLYHHTHFQVLSLSLSPSLCSPGLMTNGGRGAELKVMVCMLVCVMVGDGRPRWGSGFISAPVVVGDQKDTGSFSGF